MNKPYRRYYDKNGTLVKPGDRLFFDEDGSTEEVLLCENSYSDKEYELGINATNPDYLKHHPDAKLEAYPLYQFDHNHYEVIQND